MEFAILGYKVDK